MKSAFVVLVALFVGAGARADEGFAPSFVSDSVLVAPRGRAVVITLIVIEQLGGTAVGYDANSVMLVQWNTSHLVRAARERPRGRLPDPRAPGCAVAGHRNTDEREAASRRTDALPGAGKRPRRRRVQPPPRVRRPLDRLPDRLDGRARRRPVRGLRRGARRNMEAGHLEAAWPLGGSGISDNEQGGTVHGGANLVGECYLQAVMRQPILSIGYRFLRSPLAGQQGPTSAFSVRRTISLAPESWLDLHRRRRGVDCDSNPACWTPLEHDPIRVLQRPVPARSPAGCAAGTHTRTRRCGPWSS